MGGDLAAVICEPILAGASVIPPLPGYLERMRELTAKHGVVLIFDEVKTGFRVALGGAQELYGVLPDLSIAAKALGAGFPVGAVGGRKELFEPFTKGQVTQGSTYQANPMVLAACLATIEELRRPGFFERITSLGDTLTEGLTALANEAGITAHARGIGPILQIVFADHEVNDFRDFSRSSDRGAYRDFWLGMVDAGVMFAPQTTGCWFVSDAHTEVEIEKTLEAAGEVLMKMAAGSNSRATGART
jgi:glutamate-1-semialdehyde 2,1-aminomutase